MNQALEGRELFLDRTSAHVHFVQYSVPNNEDIGRKEHLLIIINTYLVKGCLVKSIRVQIHEKGEMGK